MNVINHAGGVTDIMGCAGGLICRAKVRVWNKGRQKRFLGKRWVQSVTATVKCTEHPGLRVY